MKRRIAITGLYLFVLLSAGWMLQSAAQQQSQKIKTTPAPVLRVEPAKQSDATGKTAAAAKAFLATLDDAGRAKVSFAFNSEQKTKWSNLPVGIYPRNGLRWGDLSSAQREALFKLLATALSKQGMQKVKEIMEGDEVLKNPSGAPAGRPPGGGPPGGGAGRAGGPIFGRDEYYLALLGTPSLRASRSPASLHGPPWRSSTPRSTSMSTSCSMNKVTKSLQFPTFMGEFTIPTALTSPQR